MTSFRLFPNPLAAPGAPFGERERAVLSHARHTEAAAEIRSWPGYAPTPLHDLPGMAEELGIGALHYKDESGRFGLGSFKALGGAYGVLRVLRRVLGDGLSAADLIAGARRNDVRAITVVCATDGNHGRSVAWGAQMFGCACVIYLPAAASAGRAEAIGAYGAELIRTTSDYDAAVRQADEDARREGWYVVSDTSYPGYEDIPRDVMQGYTVLAAEVLAQRTGPPYTHLFVPGGVGGVAAAVIGHLWEADPAHRPFATVVEPHCAGCLFASAEAGRPTVITGGVHDTIMACLACGEVSPLAWQIVERGADAFLTIGDDVVPETMCALARPTGSDPAIVAGESGAAALAGLVTVLADAEARIALGLDTTSRVLVIGTEGATDPAIYHRIVGGER